MRSGISRRAFAFGTGLAAALLALNRRVGDVFDVDPAEAFEPAAFAERSPEGFVLDAQTNHVAASKQFPQLLRLRELSKGWDPERANRPPEMGDLALENFIR